MRRDNAYRLRVRYRVCTRGIIRQFYWRNRHNTAIRVMTIEEDQSK